MNHGGDFIRKPIAILKSKEKGNEELAIFENEIFVNVKSHHAGYRFITLVVFPPQKDHQEMR
jgi:hypothetical protein